MEEFSVFLKKILAVIISAAISYASISYIPVYVVLALGFLILAFLLNRIDGKKPEFLYGLSTSNTFLDSKGGFWLLFKWLTFIPGLAYDMLVWVLFGIYGFFQIIIDILVAIKLILFWILHAIIWFLRLFYSPLRIIYKAFIRYFLFWPWWIYRLSFSNLGYFFTKPSYFIAYAGATGSLFVFLLFYAASVITGSFVIAIPGLLFAVLPLAWSFGEIASMRSKGLAASTFTEVRRNFGSGYDAIRSVGFYMVACMLIFALEVFFNLSGWISGISLSLIGLSLNLNTLLSVLLIFLFVLLLFALAIMPSYVVHEQSPQPGFSDAVRFLGVIGRRFLRYLAALFPASFFGSLTVILPIIIITGASYITIELKNQIIDTGINRLILEEASQSGVEKYITGRKIKRMRSLREYPFNSKDLWISYPELRNQKEDLGLNLDEAQKQLAGWELLHQYETDSIQQLIVSLRKDSSLQAKMNLLNMESRFEQRNADFEKWFGNARLEAEKMKADIKEINAAMIQLPFALLFIVVWISIFGGFILAALLSYFGHVYYELYHFKEDGNPGYLIILAEEEKKKNRNQPLLGFTLIILIAILAWVLFRAGIQVF